MPSSRVSLLTALGGTEKCCQTPGRSVNRRSIIRTFSSLIVFKTSSVVAQFGTMASLLSCEGCLEERAAVRPRQNGFRRVLVHAQPSTAPLPRRLRSGTATSRSRKSRCVARGPAASALVRPSHHLHGVFDMPPGFGHFRIAILF